MVDMEVAGFVAIFLCCICGAAIMDDKRKKEKDGKNDKNKQ